MSIKSQDNPLSTFKDLVLPASEIGKVTLRDLSPNEIYTVWVSAVKKGVSGPSSVFQVKTVGESLPT